LTTNPDSRAGRDAVIGGDDLFHAGRQLSYNRGMFSLKERPIIAGVISSLIIIGVGAVLDYLQHSHPSWFGVVLWGLVGCGLIAVILMPFILLKRLPKRAPEVTPENIEANIRTWFDSFRLSTKRIDDPQSLFALLATLDNDMKILITRPKLLDRYIAIHSAITISPDDKAMLDGLPAEEHGIFAMRLSVELSRTGMGYTMDLPKNTITLTRRVPITANLNEGNFMEAVDAVDNAKLGALQTLVLMLHDVKKKLPPAAGPIPPPAPSP
jgi:hypothetical protein